MMTEPARAFDAAALELFARKGREGGPGIPQCGEANGVKVRRIMQLVADLAGRAFGDLTILDLGCGEGMYALEAGMRGARVVAVDVRRERMAEGEACAARHGLDNVRFVQDDVRRVSRAGYGRFDVVFCLGLLYHLDEPDVFAVLDDLYDLCDSLLVVDTDTAPQPDVEVDHRGIRYAGCRVREHDDDDPAEVRHNRLLRSIDNTFAFLFDRRSLVRALDAVGFSSVLECHAPLEPMRREQRVTLVARKGERVKVAAYPWVNGKTEAEIEATIVAMAGDS